MSSTQGNVLIIFICNVGNASNEFFNHIYSIYICRGAYTYALSIFLYTLSLELITYITYITNSVNWLNLLFILGNEFFFQLITCITVLILLIKMVPLPGQLPKIH